MRFSQFFEDFLIETAGRPIGEEKYNFIIKNLGDLIFDEVSGNFELLERWDYWKHFRFWLMSKTTNRATTVRDVVENLDLVGDWLIEYPNAELKKILDATFKNFPLVKYSVDNFKKPRRNPLEDNGRPKRGRPPGTGKKQLQSQQPKIITVVSKKKIAKPDDYEVIGLDDIETKPKREPKPTIYLGPEDRLTKRGRKPIDDGLTAIERAKYKKEGVEKIKEIEELVNKLDLSIDDYYNNTMNKIKRLNVDKIKRMKFFGMEVSPEAEEWFQETIKSLN